MNYQYTVWLLDPLAPQDDQDREWPVCFVVEADDPDSARAWGDALAVKYAVDAKVQFCWSKLDLATDEDVRDLPKVLVGQFVNDLHIGW